MKNGTCPECSSQEIYVVRQVALSHMPPPQALVCGGCGRVELAMTPAVLATFKKMFASGPMVTKLGS